MILGIAHLCLRVADLEKSRRFYCDGLGLALAFDFVRGGEKVGFYLKAGEHNFIEFFRRGEEAVGGKIIDHLCLEVDSIDVLRQRLEAAGIALGPKGMGADHAWQAWLTDPDGVKIELHEYTADACQRTGKDCVLPG